MSLSYVMHTTHLIKMIVYNHLSVVGWVICIAHDNNTCHVLFIDCSLKLQPSL